MNNQVQFVCLWCCVPLDFVVQINNFFCLVVFSAVIHKRRGKKLISKTIKYKLDSSSKMQFAFFYTKDIQKIFWKTIDFVKNLEMTQIAWGRGSCSLCHYDAVRTKIDMRFTPYISLLTYLGQMRTGKFACLFDLTLSWRRPLPYRDQSTDLQSISMDWFLYDNGVRHERVKQLNESK